MLYQMINDVVWQQTAIFLNVYVGTRSEIKPKRVDFEPWSICVQFIIKYDKIAICFRNWQILAGFFLSWSFATMTDPFECPWKITKGQRPACFFFYLTTYSFFTIRCKIVTGEIKIQIHPMEFNMFYCILYCVCLFLILHTYVYIYM